MSIQLVKMSHIAESAKITVLIINILHTTTLNITHCQLDYWLFAKHCVTLQLFKKYIASARLLVAIAYNFL